MTLSEYIKQKRKKYGLSQVELAERAGVGLRFVRELEQGKQTLRMDKVNLRCPYRGRRRNKPYNAIDRPTVR